MGAVTTVSSTESLGAPGGVERLPPELTGCSGPRAGRLPGMSPRAVRQVNRALLGISGTPLLRRCLRVSAPRDGGGQPQPAAGGAFRVAERAEGGDREDRGGPDRQRDQVLRGGSAGDVPPSVRRRPRAGCRDRPAVRGRPGSGGWAGTRRASRSEAAAGRSVSGAGRLVAASSGPGGGHGSCPRVSWPDRSAARWAASQACRAAAGSAASRRAAA